MTSKSPILSIPVIHDAGWGSPVSRHFGKSPLHALIDLSSGTLKEWVLKPREKEKCAPIEDLAKAGVTHVACVGLGQGALTRMQNANISVHHTTGKTLKEVLTQWKAGECSEITPKQLCAGHDHDINHG
jgi:predicted Fe-Mo cluster-binding NifX family protein